MRVPILTTLSAVSAALAAMTASIDASASHYYAETVSFPYGPNADNGSFVELRTDLLHNTCNIFTHEFVTHEMWYGTDAHGPYWVEVGFNDGATYGINCTTDIIFWADSRNGGGYNEHYFPSAGWSMGTWYMMEVNRTGSCSWEVYGGGYDLGSSTSNCPGSGRTLSAGIETTSQGSGDARGFQQAWFEENNFQHWWQGWDSMGGAQSAPPSIQWTDSSMTETEEWYNVWP